MTKKTSGTRMKSSAASKAKKLASKGGFHTPKPIGKAIKWYQNLSTTEKQLIVKGLIFVVPLLIPSVRSKFPKMVKTFMGGMGGKA
ncbi:MAG: hypothetical protein J0L93_08215 [Deltaproteobacteria bacterium]|nr:hypothetical protein [Deltaproteobacteria bacterium]